MKLAKLPLRSNVTKMEMRRVTYKLYPSKAQAAALEATLDLHRRLYNAALEERISAWRLARKSISYLAQCKSLTEIRADHPEYRTLNAQSAQVTLKRLDEAFAHFFRRVKNGETPGFPRFKSRDRFPGWGYKTHGDGFRFVPGAGWRHGYLRLGGIGWIQARGEARTPGEVKACSIMRKVDGWFLSLVVACEPHREVNADAHEIGALDSGNETWMTIGRDLDDFEEIPNERFWQQEREAIHEDQRALSKVITSGGLKRRSKKALRAKERLARRHRKLSNRRKDRNHQASAAIVRRYRTIVREELALANMTRSAKGTLEKPGKNVAQKAGLNRETLDTAQGGFFTMLAYKAEEAGCELITLPTRSLKPSQRCPVSWEVRKKRLDERTHALPCGRVIGRDHAATLVMLRAALATTGREPAWLPSQGAETPSRAATRLGGV